MTDHDKDEDKYVWTGGESYVPGQQLLYRPRRTLLQRIRAGILRLLGMTSKGT